MNSVLSILALATVLAVLLMTIIYLLGRRMHNYGIVDIAWSWGFSLLVLFYAFTAGGLPLRNQLLCACVILWSGRLGWHLYRRVMGHHPEEDGRYLQLREEWGSRTDRLMFGFYQLQAAVLILLSIPYLIVVRNPTAEIHPLEWLGVVTVILAVLGEGIADAQLNRFKLNPENRGKTCRDGLWGYSRHPNYFFEWLVWMGIFAIALTSPYGWLAAISPLLILYFLLKKTGIPATEEQALRTKGDDYREYQRTTSAFIPWFKKDVL
jgi:steroid 5-alpha reductase family enzyme